MRWLGYSNSSSPKPVFRFATVTQGALVSKVEVVEWSEGRCGRSESWCRHSTPHAHCPPVTPSGPKRHSSHRLPRTPHYLPNAHTSSSHSDSQSLAPGSHNAITRCHLPHQRIQPPPKAQSVSALCVPTPVPTNGLLHLPSSSTGHCFNLNRRDNSGQQERRKPVTRSESRRQSPLRIFRTQPE